MLPDILFDLASISCYSLPILTILFFRLYRHASLIALLVYYGFSSLRCLGSNSISPGADFENGVEMFLYFLQIPLMLSALLFFQPAKQRQQKAHLLLLFFIAYEITVAALHDFTLAAGFYGMIPGLLLVVSYSLLLFLRQLRFTLLHGKNAGLVLMAGALLLSNSCSLFVYYARFRIKTADVSIVHTLHFFSTGIAALMMAGGLYLMRHRIREMQELKVTRRELQMVFGT